MNNTEEGTLIDSSVADDLDTNTLPPCFPSTINLTVSEGKRVREVEIDGE